MNFGDPRLPVAFWAKCIPEPNSGCWIWIGHTRPDGYGTLNMRSLGGSPQRVHRLAYAALVGKLDPDLVIDHRCKTRCCCNPAHLDQVTDRENVVVRADSIPARRIRQTHCVNGHEFTAENTFTRPQRPGTRECLRCQDNRNKARYRRAS